MTNLCLIRPDLLVLSSWISTTTIIDSINTHTDEIHILNKLNNEKKTHFNELFHYI